MKKIIALLLALVMVFGLVACGNSNTPSSQAPGSQAPSSQAPGSDAPASQDPGVPRRRAGR